MAELDEPANWEVVVELLYQPALGADRENGLQQRAKKTLRRGRLAAERRGELVDLGLQAHQHVVDEWPDLAQ